MEFKDRIANKPNRMKLTYEDSGASTFATVELADDPIEDGTPLNKKTFDAMQKELNAYVAGNVLITSTNRNPSEYLGGSWELIDKEYKSAFIYGDKSNDYYDKTYSIVNNNPLTNNEGTDIIRTGHTITFRLKISFNEDIVSPDSNIQIGSIHFDNLGCLRLAVSPQYPSLAFGDAANNAVFWTIGATDGRIEVAEDLRGKGFVKGDVLNFYVDLNIPYSYMVDEFCDKFYWKRTS